MAAPYLATPRATRNAAILTTLLVMASCATHPDRIEPVAQAGASCTEADRKRLAELVAEQRRAANTDAFGVLMIGLPIGSMNGPDHEDEIARLKGACG